MKTTLMLCVLANSAFAQLPIVPRITATALARLQSESPMTLLESPAKGEATVRRPEGQSIIKQSMILHDGTNWTLVPKGAVIFLPEAMKKRVDVKPTGTLVGWLDFIAKNRAWITTHDISFDQAAGKKPLQPEQVAFWPKQEKVVVAVHQRGPISVHVANPTQTSPQS